MSTRSSRRRGPEVLTNLAGLRPLLRDEDVVAFGFRDAEEQREYGSQPLPPAALALELNEVRRLGARHAAASGRELARTLITALQG